MNIRPSLEEVRQIAAAGTYDVLPVSTEILSDFTTPIETLRILKNVSKHCFLLESAQADETWGRYTFLGFDPKLDITCVGGEINGVLDAGRVKYVTGNPADYLREVLSRYKSPRFDYLPPFTGGLMGYFSYDYLGYSEPSVRVPVEDTEHFRDVDLMLFDQVIAFDHIRQKIVLISNMELDEPETNYNKAVWKLKQLRELLRTGEKKDEPGALMPILQAAQGIYGYLPIEVQTIIAEEMDVPLEKVYGISTFYAQFSLNPKGENQISVCLGTACYVKGSGQVLERIEKELNIATGQCTSDGKFSLDACRCVGACGLAPVMIVNGDVYGRMTPDQVPGILAKYK